MSLVDAFVGRRTFRLWTQLSPGGCRDRLLYEGLPFTTSSVGPDEFGLEKVVRWKYARRQTPPVVRARLTPAASGTSIVVEGRMNYAAFAALVVWVVILCGGPVLLVILPTITSGRSLRDIGPVFAFVLFMPTLGYTSALFGATWGTRDLVRLLAGLLEAVPEVADS